MTKSTTIQCSHIKANDQRCERRFVPKEEGQVECFSHRKSTVYHETTALAIPNRTPTARTFRVNLGKALTGEAQSSAARIQVLLAAAVSTWAGTELPPDAFGKITVGTKESGFVMTPSSASILMMAFPSQGVHRKVDLGEGLGVHNMCVALIEDESWGPRVIEERCGACFAAGRVCRLHDKNRWVIKVKVIAKEDGIRFEDVDDEDLLETSLCPFHAKAINKAVTRTARNTGKVVRGDRVNVYAPYGGPKGESAFLTMLKRKRDDRMRAEQEGVSYLDEDGAGTFKLEGLVQSAIEMGKSQKRRRNGRGNGNRS